MRTCAVLRGPHGGCNGRLTQRVPRLPAQDELSGADVKAMCTEAGLLALRERRMCVTQEDFKKAKEKVGAALSPRITSPPVVGGGSLQRVVQGMVAWAALQPRVHAAWVLAC